MICNITEDDFITKWGEKYYIHFAKLVLKMILEKEGYNPKLTNYLFSIIDMNIKGETIKMLVEADTNYMEEGLMDFGIRRMWASDTGMEDEILDRYNELKDAKLKL
jgi:hypothetical protein